MKNFRTYLFLLASCALFASCQKSSCSWKTGAQSYTFHRFTFVETLEKLQSLGLQYVEVYFGQPLGEGFGDLKMDFTMDRSIQKKVSEAAQARNVAIIACGVVILNTEQEWEQLFRFANDMCISIITCEPKAEHLDVVESLADRYQIDVAIHNHPQPSDYWHPDMVLKALEGRSRRMGVCADVGHWKREGVDPVKALEQVGCRLKSLHFKDIEARKEHEAEQHDVIWGKGICDVPAMLQVLKNLNFDGLMSIEYEFNWDNSVPDIRECLEMMNRNL